MVLNYPLIGLLAWKVRFVYIEPSTKWGISMEGPALVIEPSSISASTVEGSTLESRTIRDMCLYRGWLALFTSNCPRYGPLAWKVRVWDMDRPRYEALTWKVQLLNPELSVIQAQSVEGSVLENGTIRDIESQRGRFNPWIPNCP